MKIIAKKNGRTVSFTEFFEGYEEFTEGYKLHAEIERNLRLFYRDISSFEVIRSREDGNYELLMKGRNDRVYIILFSKEKDIITLESIK